MYLLPSFHTTHLSKPNTSINDPRTIVLHLSTRYFSMDGSEAELSICAGDYLLVWGNGEPAGGYYDAELLDGRRGLVPASFVQRLVGKWK